MTGRIKVTSYDESWPQWFEEESAVIQKALGENLKAVHHIGSTSVPGMVAKPKLDILVVAYNLHQAITQLSGADYEPRGAFNLPFHEVFSERQNGHNANLHVYEEGNPEIDLNLMFRNYLRSHPEAVKEYSALKVELLSQPVSHDRSPSGLSYYNLGKDKFIKKVLDAAGFDKVCMRKCTHFEEWDFARYFRQKYFFDNVPCEDPYTWTFDHKDHVHFVLYRGTKIVGYAHIQLWPDKRAALRIIVIDEPFRDQGLGSQFLNLCEKWLNENHVSALHTEAKERATHFYKKNGYQLAPFKDPDGYEEDPNDIPLAKVF